MNTAAPITLLILEDLAADRELLLHELHRQGLDPRPLPATGEADYRAALEERPEVILADYRLPAFSAERALEILAEEGLDIPLIVVSGYIGEEKAVELMRRGAVDYLLKDRLGRLGAAVTQAIDNRRLRREREFSAAALSFGEERFRLALNQIPLPFALYDEKLCIRFANERPVFSASRKKTSSDTTVAVSSPKRSAAGFTRTCSRPRRAAGRARRNAASPCPTASTASAFPTFP